MFRHCSVSQYRHYSKWLKRLANSNGSTSNEFQKILHDSLKLMQKNLPATTSTHVVSNTNEETKPKVARIKLLKKEVQKVCTSLSEKISTNKALFCTASVAAVGQESTDQQTNVTTSAETLAQTSREVPLDPIPEPPPIPGSFTEATQEVLNQLNALGEPTFASLGLGGWTPVGIVQNCMEFLHVTLGIDWWAAIALGTLVIRLCMFPLVIISQRNAAKMNNYMPQMQVLQLKLTEARQAGNALEAARYSQELVMFMKEKNLNPFKSMIPAIAQMPVFVSFFVGLRQMANTPVESLKTGGLFWFTDLTLPDQFFLMPVITSLTLLATIELGTDTGKMASQNMMMMKYVLRALPVVIFPFIMNFPGAILCYWVSSNFISLGQVAVLRLPAVRRYLKIDQLIHHSPDSLPIKQKGFREGLKESWTNVKLTRELEERRKLDEMQFQRAGRGPIVKTYKYDPTKQTSPSTAPAVSAKKR